MAKRRYRNIDEPRKDTYYEEFPHRWGRIKHSFRQEARAWEQAIEQGVTPRRRRSFAMLHWQWDDDPRKRRPYKNWKWQRKDRYEERIIPLCAILESIALYSSWYVHSFGEESMEITFPPIYLEDCDMVLRKVWGTAEWNLLGHAYPYFDDTVYPVPERSYHQIIERGDSVFKAFQPIKWSLDDLTDWELRELQQRLKAVARQREKEMG